MRTGCCDVAHRMRTQSITGNKQHTAGHTGRSAAAPAQPTLTCGTPCVRTGGGCCGGAGHHHGTSLPSAPPARPWTRPTHRPRSRSASWGQHSTRWSRQAQQGRSGHMRTQHAHTGQTQKTRTALTQQHTRTALTKSCRQGSCRTPHGVIPEGEARGCGLPSTSPWLPTGSAACVPNPNPRPSPRTDPPLPPAPTRPPWLVLWLRCRSSPEAAPGPLPPPVLVVGPPPPPLLLPLLLLAPGRLPRLDGRRCACGARDPSPDTARDRCSSSATAPPSRTLSSSLRAPPGLPSICSRF